MKILRILSATILLLFTVVLLNIYVNQVRVFSFKSILALYNLFSLNNIIINNIQTPSIKKWQLDNITLDINNNIIDIENISFDYKNYLNLNIKNIHITNQLVIVDSHSKIYFTNTKIKNIQHQANIKIHNKIYHLHTDFIPNLINNEIDSIAMVLWLDNYKLMHINGYYKDGAAKFITKLEQTKILKLIPLNDYNHHTLYNNITLDGKINFEVADNELNLIGNIKIKSNLGDFELKAFTRNNDLIINIINRNVEVGVIKLRNINNLFDNQQHKVSFDFYKDKIILNNLDYIESIEANNVKISAQAYLQNGHVKNGKGCFDIKIFKLFNNKMFFIDNQLLAKFDNSNFIIEHLKLNQPKKGQFIVKGMSVFNLSHNYKFIANNINLDITNILKGVCDANIVFQSKNNNNLLEGDIAFKHANVELALINSDKKIPKLKIIDHEQPSNTRSLKSIKLDIKTNLSNNFTIKGHNLAADITGFINVGGDTILPKINSELKVNRGEYTFLDKSFVIKNSQIFMNNNQIYVQINAIHKQNNIKYVINISGYINQLLNIKLSSIPAMPQDLIFANLLFGKHVNQLSPFEMAMLARQLYNLSINKHSDFSINNIIKKFKLNKIKFSKDNENNYTLTVKKKLNKDLTLAIEGSTNDKIATKMIIEKKISDKLSIFAKSGAEGIGGLGVGYRHRY